ncbi:hypothetical protein AQ490_16145 [Wenjunlia vitaminophila]|uniref:Thioesterase domain-containing protein n=1 Tax=Wenjunlia vitaminophila TaxID=76728 RepID=A0A0T6LWV8_WENVI|nr:alpha/beta fold hydrolase [Wenjunlia vitaminophila]KRV50590.1 hypothetical protein AQ490_16145 [Wenjunlia vitaminophila]
MTGGGVRTAVTGRVTGQRRSPWFTSFEDRPEASLRLVCLPFAGGGAAAYRSWLSRLPRSVELNAVQLPGRQDRVAEKALTGHQEIVLALADALAGEPDDRPYAFFGHSMGALLAFELARELRGRGAPAPVLLGVSGLAAPSTGPFHGAITHLPDDAFLEAVATLGGMPDEILASPSLIDFLLPTLRADFGVCEGYRYRRQAPLDCPLVVFSGIHDPATPLEDLRGWQAESTRPVRLRQHPGGHFYLLDQPDAVVGALVSEVREALAAGADGAGTSGWPVPDRASAERQP